jgi:hypothetical protein
MVILTNFAGFLAATMVATTVRAVPESGAVETVLLFGYYAAMLLAAFCDALLLDELLFKGAFRRSHLQGKSSRYTSESDDVGEVAATMQRSTVSFPFLLLLCAVATYLLFNVINNDFDVYHRRVGKHISAMHQGDTAEQVEAIQELSIRREPEVFQALKWKLAQGGEAAPWAAWALGRFTDLATRRPLKAPLTAAASSSDPLLRREGLVALGRIQHRAAGPQLHAEIRAQRDLGEPVDPRLLYGLGSIQIPESVPLLEELLHGGKIPTQRIAAWALAQHRDIIGMRKTVITILEERLPTADHEVKCAIIHSLGITSDERSNSALRRAYDAATPEERATVCPRWQLSLRPDGNTDDRADLFMPQDTLAMKIIMIMAQLRATDPKIRAEIEPWLDGVIEDDETTPATREAARALLQGILEGRNDNEMKSVEEALGID